MRREHRQNSVIAYSLMAFFVVMIVAATSAPLAQAVESKKQSASEKVYRIGFHLWKPGKIYDEAMAGIKDGLELQGIHYEEVILHSKL